MRVVLVGERSAGGLTSSLARAFDEIGWETVDLTWGPWRPAWVAAAAVHRPEPRPLLHALWRRAVRGAVEADLALVVKGPFVDARGIAALRRRAGAPVVCWNPDDPFDDAVSNRGAGIPDAVPAYDAYVTWSDDVADRILTRRRDVLVVPFGWDPALHHPEPADAPDVRGRLVFIGSWTAERERTLRRLSPLSPVVYGNRWPQIDGIETRGELLGARFRQVVGAAGWNLNLLRSQNARSHNMRTFELPACDGMQLAPRTPDHERFLRPSHAVLFDDTDDIASIVAASPARVGDRAWLGQHTYAARVTHLLQLLGLAGAT